MINFIEFLSNSIKELHCQLGKKFCTFIAKRDLYHVRLVPLYNCEGPLKLSTKRYSSDTVSRFLRRKYSAPS